ncbi:HpaII family restriction endonuclease [Flagellimonas sp.]|uniref:HpaII family restriction endonuclease n=1 Tax=Flagellimonas sp. TaxID=2058762 RepID=UPI003B502F5A
MIESVYTFSKQENKIIISGGYDEISVSKSQFDSHSVELKTLMKSLGKPFINTNITYKVSDSSNNPIGESHLNEVNEITTGHKYIKRIAKLIDLGYNINFHSYDDDTFRLNLQVIDSALPEIIAYIVKDKYVSQITKITDVIRKIREDNPIGYDLSQGHKFYEYRLVNFLVEAALGMTSKTVWSGKYDVVGGIIIVKPSAELLCYHLIDFNKFRQYLKVASRLDNPSGSKMGYGSVYSENGESFIKLNFQIKA